MPKRQPANTPRKSRQAAPASSRSGWRWVFWPFALVNWLTRQLFWPLRWMVRLAAYPAVLLAAALVAAILVYGGRAERYDMARVHEMPERSIVFDRTGQEIARIHGEKRLIVPLSQVSDHFRKAILAREDERFYHHGAVDPLGILRAMIKNAVGKREGASTITQQLASDIFQLKRGEQRGDTLRQLDRKMLEIAIAFRLETMMDKDEILETYINQINWGRQIKGIGEAARVYFEKHPAALNLSESALLAGIVRGPDAYNPFRSMDAARRERNTTLQRMVDAGAISQADADAAMKQTIEVRPKWRRDAKDSYAMEAIRRDLEVILEKEDIELGGLEITTTIDQRIQQKAEEAVDKRLTEIERTAGYAHPTRAAWAKAAADQELEPKYIQGAAVVIENRTGAVLAVVGGRDTLESRFNRAKEARRQLGSIFKPFVYLAAFDKGLAPDTPISDGPLNPGEIKGAHGWYPQNSDGKFGGDEPAAYGLIRSRNTMSVRVGNYAGMPLVRQVAKMAGFGNEVPDNPASFLGTWDASPWEVCTAYTMFPNEGQRYRPYLISEIKDRDGNVLYSTLPLSYQAASGVPTVEVSKILQEVTDSGTAAAVRRLGFDKPCGGKTGTTNDFKDAWFAGYTSQLTCTVWCGFDQPQTTIHGGYGAVLALPIWVEIMKTADHLGYKAGRLDEAVRKANVELCRLSAKMATSGCEYAGTAYSAWVPADTVPAANDLCPIHPARAMAVGGGHPKAVPVEEPARRATPVAEPVRRAVPVQEPVRRAIPVQEAPPRAVPVQ